MQSVIPQERSCERVLQRIWSRASLCWRKTWALHASFLQIVRGLSCRTVRGTARWERPWRWRPAQQTRGEKEKKNSTYGVQGRIWILSALTDDETKNFFIHFLDKLFFNPWCRNQFIYHMTTLCPLHMAPVCVKDNRLSNYSHICVGFFSVCSGCEFASPPHEGVSQLP